MTRLTTNLSSESWYFGHVPPQPFTAEDIYDLSAVDIWLPATIPGNVRTDLLSLELIPEPFIDEGYKNSLWVENVDWWYKCELTHQQIEASQQAYLMFAGIDYLSAIFINGQEQSRHEGMFSRQIIDLTKFLQQSEVITIAVRIWGSEALPTRQLNWLQTIWQAFASKIYTSWVGIYPDRTATLKSQMSFGWDFAPPIRTMGIWDEAQLIVTEGPAIIEASVIGIPQAKNENVNITIPLTVACQQPAKAKVQVEITPANFEATLSSNLVWDLRSALRTVKQHSQS
ncbi:MAG: sugar-binding domain-containing protein [Chloroflexota bacterium]